jgi:RalA-binding protein 1
MLPSPSTTATPPAHPSPSPSLAASIHPPRDSTRSQNVPATSDEQHSRPPAGRRKPAPSPLVASTSTSTSTSTGRPPYHEEPRSPREKLDQLLAEEELHNSAPSTNPPTAQSTTTPTIATTTRRPAAHAQLRHASSPTLSLAGLSPPASPVTMPPPSRPRREQQHPSAAPRWTRLLPPCPRAPRSAFLPAMRTDRPRTPASPIRPTWPPSSRRQGLPRQP